MAASNTKNISDAKINAISSFLTLCERSTINLNESLTNAVKAAIIICLKFVDKEALFRDVLPDTFIDWEYVKAQYTSSTCSSSGVASRLVSSLMSPSSSSYSLLAGTGGSSNLLSKMRGNANLLGDSAVWLQIMQFIDFGNLKLSERLLQQQHPPLFCLYVAVMSHVRNNSSKKNSTEEAPQLDFSDVCKLLVLNNVEGLSARSIIEMHTSSRLNQNTYTLCNNIVSTLADERHSSEVYQEAFRYVFHFFVVSFAGCKQSLILGLQVHSVI